MLLREIPLLSAPLAEVGGCTAFTVESSAAATTATLTGVHRKDGTAFTDTVPGDVRPQIVGVFTDLPRARLGDAHLHADIDSRFSSSPTLLKTADTVLAVLFTLIALIALHRLDTADGRRPRRFLPGHWWKFGLADAVVLGTLVLWHIIGANTSDDGYILNMARTARHSGYMSNYYRWFGVAEAPFGWPYEVLAWMTRISDSSPWMRLPSLLAGILCWLVLSREVLPRLGARVRRDSVALWTGGLIFLAAWLPYDNGLRPEPLIALGALLTWASIERAIATGRLLPAAIGVLIAAFSLAAGPTGLICIAALIAGSRPVLQIIIKRAKPTGRGIGSAILRYGALLAPGIAAGTLVLVVVFADQTLAAVMEATRVRTLIGPNVAWFDERTRWDALLSLSPDGSLSRRFGILGMLLCLAVCVLVMLRKSGRIPGTSRGPSARIQGIVFMSLLLMMFTPTKWTHHFGVYAGLAGSVAALTAVAVGANGIRAPLQPLVVRGGRVLPARGDLHRLQRLVVRVQLRRAVVRQGAADRRQGLLHGLPGPGGAVPVAHRLAVLPRALSKGRLAEALRPARDRTADDRRRRDGALRGRLAGQGRDHPVPGLLDRAVESARTDRAIRARLANDVLVETNTADSLLQPYSGSAAQGLAAETCRIHPRRRRGAT